ncbi:tetrapyrrole biosynthesis, uroporphyrinogen III synthase [Pavlovales sp. CCMP2436]|nr:tetrapyrrole biosynthesis, uroporphyrinogen III synthase [Pavlovales sp. CCMP2436]
MRAQRATILMPDKGSVCNAVCTAPVTVCATPSMFAKLFSMAGPRGYSAAVLALAAAVASPGALAARPMMEQVPTQLLPLANRRVMLTGHRSSVAPRLGARLAERGARPLFMPTVSLEPLAETAYAPLDEALLRLPDYDVVCLPSADAVRALYDRTAALLGFNRQMISGMLAGVRLATLGNNAYLVKDLLGVSASVVPPESSLSGMANALEALGLARSGAKVLVLLPAYTGMAEPPSVTRFVAQLEATGATIVRVAVCIAAPTPLESAHVEIGLLLAGQVDALVFTSGSEVEGLYQLLCAAKAAAERGAPERAFEATQATEAPSVQGQAITALEWSLLLPGHPLAIASYGADAMLSADVWGVEQAVVSPLGVIEELVQGLEKQLASGGGLIF